MEQTLRLTVLLVWLIILAREDLKEQTVNLWAAAAAAGCGAAWYLLTAPFAPEELAGGAGVGGILLLASWVSRGKIAAGDGLVLCICGIYLGTSRCLGLLCGASAAGAAAGGILLLQKKKKLQDRIPFIPCLCGVHAWCVLTVWVKG
jgi:leader peptidase (prepilin peptidase)/N-methyltransferase